MELARVLGTERYRFDRASELSLVDLALGWGPMSDTRALFPSGTVASAEASATNSTTMASRATGNHRDRGCSVTRTGPGYDSTVRAATAGVTRRRNRE